MKKLSGTAGKVYKKISEVMDPELYVSITELGLVYDVTIKGSKALVTMTLTSIGCPLFSIIEKEVEDRAKEVKGVSDTTITLTFDPPWSMDKMSEKAKAELSM